MVSQALVRADSLAPGMTLGRYQLIHRLAVGGMAEIFLARATGIEGFEKLVVLKRILPQFASNGDFVSMFLDEARLSATLQHPNVVTIHDIGQWQGSYFFTMEYIHGEDVRTILKTVVRERRRVPLSHCLAIISGTAAGLHYAHEKRSLDGRRLDIVHRDVSPSNVLVSYEGAVKVVDFGVAKAAERQHETQAGTLKGKVAYMSPEQCRGKPIDHRSDIFALGILLYELTTHRRLFQGDSEYEIMSKIVNRDVTPPTELIAKYPKQLETIVMKALRRNRAERYQSAQQMQLDIEDFARRHRLSLSSVKLGSFMRDLFADRMREQQELIERRARTEDGVEPDEGNLSISVRVEPACAAELDGAAAAPAGPGGAVSTAMFDVDIDVDADEADRGGPAEDVVVDGRSVADVIAFAPAAEPDTADIVEDVPDDTTPSRPALRQDQAERVADAPGAYPSVVIERPKPRRFRGFALVVIGVALAVGGAWAGGVLPVDMKASTAPQPAADVVAPAAVQEAAAPATPEPDPVVIVEEGAIEVETAAAPEADEAAETEARDEAERDEAEPAKRPRARTRAKERARARARAAARAKAAAGKRRHESNTKNATRNDEPARERRPNNDEDQGWGLDSPFPPGS